MKKISLIQFYAVYSRTEDDVMADTRRFNGERQPSATRRLIVNPMGCCRKEEIV